MGKVIVITSGKGGVGKTTAVANIGSGLAKVGKKVALIDGDIGLRNLDLIMGLENRIVFDLFDVVHKKCRSYKQALIKDKRFSDTLFLLPAPQSKEKDAVQPEQMRQLCEEMKTEFDFLIIDCPAGIEHGFKNAVAGADEAIIITNPEVSAVRDADRIIGLLEAQEKNNLSLIINRYKKELVKKGDMLSIDDVREILNVDLLGIVPEDERILHCSNKGEPAILDQSSSAGEAYRSIVERIINPGLEFNIKKEKGFFEKVKNFFTLKRN